MATPKVTAVQPLPWRGQLETGAPTRRKDCGVATFLYMVKASSRNRVGPRQDQNEWADWVSRARHEMGAGDGPTDTDMWAKAWRSDWLRAQYRRAGLQVPVVSELAGTSWTRLRELLRAGRIVGLCVDNGVLIDQGLPTGAPAFRDGHALMLSGLTTASGLTYTLDADPTFLDGPRVVRLRPFREAAGRFGDRPWGPGRVQAVAVRRALALDATEPPLPAPLDVPAELAKLTAQSGQLTQAIAALAARIEAGK